MAPSSNGQNVPIHLPGQATTSGTSSYEHASSGSQPSHVSSMPTAPTLSLPKGGGAITGMGEKFDVNLNTGTASTSVPVHVSPGRSGMQPELSLSYDSGAGNGEFGLGWRLQGWGTITRKTSKGLPQYNDNGLDMESDVFLLSGVEDLVPLFKRDAHGDVILDVSGHPAYDEAPLNGFIVRRYAARIIQTFSRIERWTNLADSDDVHWRVLGPQNQTTIYGKNSQSRIYDPNARQGDPLRIFSWLEAERYDTHGNAMIFNYKSENSVNVPILQANEAARSEISRSANRYLQSIQYGNVLPNRLMDSWLPISAFDLPQNTWKFSVVFDYGEYDKDNPKLDDSGFWECRLDPFSNYHSGFEVRTYRLCQRILMFHHFDELKAKDYLVGSTDFTYDLNPITSYLTSIQQAGYAMNARQAGYIRRVLPPVSFEYSLFPTDSELQTLVVQDVESSILRNLPIGLDGSDYQWVDLDGEGLSGILTEQGQAWYYKRNTSANNLEHQAGQSNNASDSFTAVHARLSELQILSSRPSLSMVSQTVHFGDVQGAGKLDLIQTSPISWGYFERDPEKMTEWNTFRAFPHFPNLDTTKSDVKFVDLTGDGLPDILISADQIYCWYPSLAADGYGPGRMVTQPPTEDVGPVCVFADPEQTIYVADMSGDGLADIVRIRNNDICYWPNCGYGRFGSLVRVDNSPCFDHSDTFRQSRIRLADIDGSGTTDIIYLGTAGVDIYLNQSGNSFSDRKRLPSFAPIDDMAVVNTLDLLGNGTTCIVWSSRAPSASQSPLRYVDLMRGRKPHLLTKLVNNLGTEMRVHYSPSTKFYLQDEVNGTPWLTRLPFPVHCVETVETTDNISKNRFVKQYSYHHGYFDGVEREFRGFARVEEWDTDSYVAMSKVDSSNIDATWHVPPVHTKTWFHTGVYISGDMLSRQMAFEYLGAPSSGDQHAMDDFYASLLPDTVAPVTVLEADAFREACRALKGHVLRREVYGEDGSAKAGIPYTVQEQNFTVEVSQPIQDAHLHSVYVVHPRETISYNYERNIDDARIEHEMILQVDDYGNVLKSLKIAYGRQLGKSPLSGLDKAKQETTLFLYSEHKVTKLLSVDNDYRIPTPYESNEYELSGFRLQTGNARFSMSNFDANDFSPLHSLTDISFEEKNDPSIGQKRLTKLSRVLFRKDDLSGILPPGEIQSLGLPGSEYHLCFTPGLLNSIFKRQVMGQPQEMLISDPKSVLVGLGKAQGGYVDLDNDGHYWKTEGRIFFHSNSAASPVQELAEARTHFFEAQSFVDPFGNATVVTYDAYSLFPVLVRDPTGNLTSTTMDYRVLAPALLTDPNGNQNAVRYDALGMVAGTATMGKAGENKGDSLDNFSPDLTQAEVDQIFADPKGAISVALLGNATTRIVVDRTRYWRDGEKRNPSYTAIIARQAHLSDPIQPGILNVQEKFSYSDGFGRVIQEKKQAKSGPLTDGGPDVMNRWVGTGWTISNNKGKPVREFEPFFDDTHDFKYAMEIGVSPIIFYDPLLRVVATLRQDHSFEKVIFDAWSQTHHDASDNVKVSNPRDDSVVGHFFDLLPEKDYLPSWYDARISGKLGQDEIAAAMKTEAHSNTPRISHLDVMERQILSIDSNGSTDLFLTRFTFDIQGNQRAVVDPNNCLIMIYDFSMCGDNIHQASMESGEKWTLPDVFGHPFLSWNSRNFRFRIGYDSARRQTESWVREGTSDEILFQENVYGELALNAQDHNLRGRIFRSRDQAGEVVANEFDFKGNLISSRRQLAKDYRDTLDWSKVVELEETLFTTRTTFDALNRPIRSVAPDMSITSRIYDEGGHLGQSFVNIKGEQNSTDPATWTPIILDVDNNAKNQITKTLYGNETITERTYEPLLSRLSRIRTTRPSTGSVLQDLNYTYDPMGNITSVRDLAQQVIYFRNNRVDPGSEYAYDPMYRLIQATGREHLGQTNGKPSQPSVPAPMDAGPADSPTDGNAIGSYTETYFYDSVGNILSVSHAGSDPKSPGWTRQYTYSEPSQLEPSKFSNRLSSTSIGSSVERYKYDDHGNFVNMPHLSFMQWDFQDRLRATSRQVVSNGNIPEITYYVYDSSGHRVRKAIDSQASPNGPNMATRMKERIYLDNYEIYHTFAPNGIDMALERTTLDIQHENERIVQINCRTQGTDPGSERAIHFQLSNRLGSTCLELDHHGLIISYEEFFPLGGSSYRSVTNQNEVPKRYRYSGKEKDEESGLYYYGARYYASWLGRWISPDPGGLKDGPNLYQFTRGNPITYKDQEGRQTAPPMPWVVPAAEEGLGALAARLLAPAVPLLRSVAAGGPVVAFLAVIFYPSPIARDEDYLPRALPKPVPLAPPRPVAVPVPPTAVPAKPKQIVKPKLDDMIKKILKAIAIAKGIEIVVKRKKKNWNPEWHHVIPQSIFKKYFAGIPNLNIDNNSPEHGRVLPAWIHHLLAGWYNAMWKLFVLAHSNKKGNFIGTRQDILDYEKKMDKMAGTLIFHRPPIRFDFDKPPGKQEVLRRFVRKYGWIGP